MELHVATDDWKHHLVKYIYVKAAMLIKVELSMLLTFYQAIQFQVKNFSYERKPSVKHCL